MSEVRRDHRLMPGVTCRAVRWLLDRQRSRMLIPWINCVIVHKNPAEWGYRCFIQEKSVYNEDLLVCHCCSLDTWLINHRIVKKFQDSLSERDFASCRQFCSYFYIPSFSAYTYISTYMTTTTSWQCWFCCCIWEEEIDTECHLKWIVDTHTHTRAKKHTQLHNDFHK